MRHRLTMRGLILLLAGLVVIAVGTGIGVAMITQNDTLHACAQTNYGQLRLVDGPDDCRPNEYYVTWNQEGPPGPQGIQGPQGEAGPKGEAGPQGPAGPSAAYMNYYASEGIPANFTPLGSLWEPVKVLAVDVPAGDYVVSGFADLIGVGGGAHCWVGTTLTHMWGPGALVDIYASIPVTGAVSRASAGEIMLLCAAQELPSPSVGDRRLIATQVGSLTDQTPTTLTP